MSPSTQSYVISESPENRETPLRDAQSWVTPGQLFFVRSHYDTPEVDLDTWRLRIGGCVRKELELTWDPPWTPDRMSDDAKFILGFG